MIVLCAWHSQYFGKHEEWSNSIDHVWRPLTKQVIEIIASKPNELSHGLCPRCQKRWMEDEGMKEVQVGGSEPDRIEEIVVFCLHPKCKRTTMFGQKDWSENIERHQRVEKGLCTSMMGPYCNLHDNQGQPPSKAA